MGEHAQRPRDRPEPRGQADQQRVQAHERQHEHHRDPRDERGDLIAGHARRPHPNAREPQRQQPGPHVLCDRHAPLRMRARGEAERNRDGQRERDPQEEDLPHVLAKQQLELGDRLSEDDLEHAAACVLGERAHRHRRDEEQEQPR